MSQDNVPGPISGHSAHPFFRSIQNEMNELLDRFRGRELASPGDVFDTWGAPSFPALDIAATENALEITAEVPGVQEEDSDISISGNVLIIKG